MKLQTKERTVGKRSEITGLRRNGFLPAVVYSKKSGSQAIAVSASDFESALRAMKEGHLPTTVFEITVDGKAVKAVVKDIDYHPTTYAVRHLDFQILEANTPIKVNVPIVCYGVADCAGIKLGGMLRQVRRHIPVLTTPEKMPTHFKAYVKDLGLKQSLKASVLELGDGVKSLFPLSEVVVTIAKR